MKLYMFILLLVGSFISATDKELPPLIMRREVIARSRTGTLICSVIYDSITNKYIGSLINNYYYPHEKWACKKMSNEEAKSYFVSFSYFYKERL